MTTFVDRVVLHAHAGDGGHGCASIKREKFRPLAGPDGGNGGRGGDIVLKVDHGTNSLLAIQRLPHRKAPAGRPGAGDNRSGKDGEDVVITVPDGTVVSTTDGVFLADMVGPGKTYVVAKGGRGGLGNAALASPRRKAPGFALLGTAGDQVDAVLELKTLADVGLVGFPSAGKSSLVSVLSSARPKIADYPFTTLVPHLGVVKAGSTVFTVADVPGLIAGASAGKGLGLEFLRHIERCAALVHVVDCATLEPDRDPISDIDTLEDELALYGGLADRPRLVALNKCDVPEAADLAQMVAPMLAQRGWPVFLISTVSHAGLKELTYAMASVVAEFRAQQQQQEQPDIVIVQPGAVDDSGFEVSPEGDGFRVRGARPTRWVQQTDFGNDEAVGYLGDRLARLGVEEELLRLGAQPGATVVIGSDDDAVVFDWQPSIYAGQQGGGSAPRGHDVRLDDL